LRIFPMRQRLAKAGITSRLSESPSNEFDKSRQRELYGEMSKETPRLPDRRDWDNLAADALELARLMPPGPERSEALKLASQLRCTADARGLIPTKRGSPRR
jgi:hypothetical protein